MKPLKLLAIVIATGLIILCVIVGFGKLFLYSIGAG